MSTSSSEGQRPALSWSRLAWQSARAVWGLVRCAPHVRLRHLRAVREATRRAREADPRCSPLRRVNDGLHEIDPRWLGAVQTEPLRCVDPMIVLHFVGTGETRHGPLPCIARLVRACPALRTQRHFVVDGPADPLAYEDLATLSPRVWTALEPLIDASSGPFVLVGLSRGGALALEVAARIADEKRKAVSCIALSPPLARPRRLPRIVEMIAGFGTLASAYTDAVSRGVVPSWLTGLATRVVRTLQLAITAYVLADLQAADEETIAWSLRDLREDDGMDSALRQVGEFGLLQRTSEVELVRFTRFVTRSLVHNELAWAVALWGEEDTWLSASACRGQIEQALKRLRNAHGAIATSMVPGRHNLSRGANDDFDALSPHFERAVHEARARAEHEARRQRSRARLERRMREGLTTAEPASEERHV
ncbi:alpha/beta fold hydrolase [Sandaracinus amylolyticus]|uniref:alpha/beta fold hydrolase n=1 Tax=Sandaracinus amylolyticus TaxID=927083 RepID=UPI001F20F599|nr:alpha/beta fold hydrolase [Sandaracinus amylolyticus]UJR80041.1 Hypothetical protein I5071_20850 [Sandaracinus amylolyticus]